MKHETPLLDNAGGPASYAYGAIPAFVAMASFLSLPLTMRVYALFPLFALLAHDVLAFLPPAPPAAASHLLDATLDGHAGATCTIAMVSKHFGNVSTSSTSRGRRRRSKPIGATRTRLTKICRSGDASSRADFLTLFAATMDDPSSDINNQAVVTGVTLKLAIDSSPACWGIADLSASKSERFTSPQSLDLVHRLRAVSDCVLVGRGTVAADDCTLTVRRGYEAATVRDQPTRVVLASHLQLIRDHVDGSCDASYRLFDDGLPVIMYHLGTTADDDDMVAFLRDRPVITLVDASKLGPTFESDDDESVLIQGGSALQTFSPSTRQPASIGTRSILSPQLVVRDLRRRGMHHVMVEGGAATARSFLRAGVVDRAILVQASVQFEEPLDSNIDAAVLGKEGGLKLLGTSDEGDGDMFGGDSLQYWVRRGDGNEYWPSLNLTNWP